MLRILVRSKRDADAVRASLERFPETSAYSVESLGGVRGERLVERIAGEARPFTVVLLGREDEDYIEPVRRVLSRVPFTAAIVARTKRVRNSTIEMINALVTRARVMLRLQTTWTDSGYLLSNGSGDPVAVNLEPSADLFFIFDNGVDLLSEVLGVELPRGVYLAEKLPLDHHLVFDGPKVFAEYNAASGAARARGRLVRPIVNTPPASLRYLADLNKHVLDVLVEKTIEFTRKIVGDWRGRIVVPLSGGKDSTAALYIAVRTFGADMVTAVYVDTGIDFEENRETARSVAEKVGVDLIEVEAGVDRGLLLERMPLPSPENRWCTGRKLEALRRALRKLEDEYGRILLIVGDRDAESDRRSKRPMLRVDRGLPYPTLSPLRLWSGAHVEILIARLGLPLNPLYHIGFYRTGCYLCFALRGWEIMAMKRTGIFERIAKARPAHTKLISEFLRSRSAG